jgi:hypothetical protein
MAEHSINLGYHMLLNDTTIPAKKPRLIYRTIREAEEIMLQHYTNIDDGFSLSMSQKPLIHTIKE